MKGPSEAGEVFDCETVVISEVEVTGSGAASLKGCRGAASSRIDLSDVGEKGWGVKTLNAGDRAERLMISPRFRNRRKTHH